MADCLLHQHLRSTAGYCYVETFLSSFEFCKPIIIVFAYRFTSSNILFLLSKKFSTALLSCVSLSQGLHQEHAFDGRRRPHRRSTAGYAGKKQPSCRMVRPVGRSPGHLMPVGRGPGESHTGSQNATRRARSVGRLGIQVTFRGQTHWYTKARKLYILGPARLGAAPVTVPHPGSERRLPTFFRLTPAFVLRSLRKNGYYGGLPGGDVRRAANRPRRP